MKEKPAVVDAGALIAEGFGTMALVFFGTGACVVNDQLSGSLGPLGIALSFGIVVMAVIYAFGQRSGAHINPAVTIAFLVARKIPFSKALFYVIVQCVGAIAGSLLVSVIWSQHEMLGVTMPAGSIWQSFILEVILSFFLMLVIFQMATGSKEAGISAALSIGAVVFLDALVGGSTSGASMNPARSLGPALVSGHLNHLWLYLTAPVLGMLLSLPVFNLIHRQQ